MAHGLMLRTAIAGVLMKYAYEHSSKEGADDGFDFRYFVNCSNALFIKAENEGLRTKNSLDYFMMVRVCAHDLCSLLHFA